MNKTLIKLSISISLMLMNKVIVSMDYSDKSTINLAEFLKQQHQMYLNFSDEQLRIVETKHMVHFTLIRSLIKDFYTGMEGVLHGFSHENSLVLPIIRSDIFDLIYHFMQLIQANNFSQMTALLNNLDNSQLSNVVEGISYLGSENLLEHVILFIAKKHFNQIYQWFNKYTNYGINIAPEIKNQINSLIGQLMQELTTIYTQDIVQRIIEKVNEMTKEIHKIEFKIFAAGTTKTLQIQILGPVLNTENLKATLSRHIDRPIDLIKLIIAGRILKEDTDATSNALLLKKHNYKIYTAIEDTCSMHCNNQQLCKEPLSFMTYKCHKVDDLSTKNLKLIASKQIGLPEDCLLLHASGVVLNDHASSSANLPLLQSCNYKIEVIKKNF